MAFTQMVHPIYIPTFGGCANLTRIRIYWLEFEVLMENHAKKKFLTQNLSFFQLQFSNFFRGHLAEFLSTMVSLNNLTKGNPIYVPIYALPLTKSHKTQITN
eukprot:TRINITY_DN3663_c0_g1_i1.p1 TRINITY_DN3663_c0_g1~~TRINITY_DN3663_c0_g1_i1.p1  ORF type:complete len:102 (+),score=0.06 TRINITY_DN3663_c0_g1_i1:929-1234(+)